MESWQRWNKQNSERRREINRNWVRKNPKKHQIRLTRWITKLRLQVFNHYSDNDIKCACCGERNLLFLTLDHINNDGARHRSELYGKRVRSNGSKILTWVIKNNYPDGFQVLCMNCNWGKHRNKGVCPHKTTTR